MSFAVEVASKSGTDTIRRLSARRSRPHPGRVPLIKLELSFVVFPGKLNDLQEQRRVKPSAIGVLGDALVIVVREEFS